MVDQHPGSIRTGSKSRSDISVEVLAKSESEFRFGLQTAESNFEDTWTVLSRGKHARRTELRLSDATSQRNMLHTDGFSLTGLPVGRVRLFYARRQTPETN